MTTTGNEFFDTFGDEFKSVATRLERLEKITDSDLIVMPDGTTYTMGDLGLSDVSVRVYIQADAPTGLNSSTSVGDVWIDTDDDSQWFWDGLMWVSKGPGDNYAGGTGLEAFGPGVVSRLLTTIDITNQATAPVGPTYGDTWRDTANGNIIKRWNGSTWVQITDQNIINAVVAALTDEVADVTDNTVRVFYTSAAPGGMNATTHKGDLWFDTDDHYFKRYWDGTAWINADAEPVESETDGLPPAYSPTPTIVPGIGSLFVTWDTVPNEDPIWYNVYVSTTTPVQQIGANNLGRVEGEVMVIQALPDDTPLQPETTYYVAMVAVDADGVAPLSPEASGQIMLIDLGQFEQDVRTSIENIPTIQATANGKNTNYYQDAEPTGGTYKINDAWFDTGDGYRPYYWDGDSWAPFAFDTQAFAAGSVTTAILDAGAVTADKISANSISADALIIGSYGSGMVLNPSFEADTDGNNKPDGWTLAEGSDGAWKRTNLADSPDGQYVLEIPPALNAGIGSKAFPVTPGQTFYSRVRVRGTGTTGTYTIRMNYSATAPPDGYVTSTSRTSYTDIKPATTHSTAWSLQELAWTVPANAKWASIVIINGSASSTLYADDVDFRNQASSVMIADGAIVANKIGASQIISNHIASLQITSDKLASNSVIAGKIAANAITASNIQAGQITSTHLTSSSVTADKLSASAIDGKTIYGVYIYGNRFKSTQYSWGYVELGDVGTNDAAHEIRFINSGTTMSLRNPSQNPGSLYVSMQSGGLSNIWFVEGLSDGYVRHGRSGGGPKIKYAGDTVQIRTHSDGDYHDMRLWRLYYVGQTQVTSILANKESVERVSLDPLPYIKKNGLHKWDWKGSRDEAGKPKKGVGIIADYLPESVRDGEGYDVGGVTGLMWEAIRALTEKVERLEGGQ